MVDPRRPQPDPSVHRDVARHVVQVGAVPGVHVGEQVEHPVVLHHALAGRDGTEIGDTLALMEREIRENGITYNVYAERDEGTRPWPLELLAALMLGALQTIVKVADLI